MQRHGWGWGYILLGICEVGCGVLISIKIDTASGGGVGSFARRPSITPTYSETILSNLKSKKAQTKQKTAKLKKKKKKKKQELSSDSIARLESCLFKG